MLLQNVTELIKEANFLSLDRVVELAYCSLNRYGCPLQLIALEAIYGDDLTVFENKGGLRSFQVP